MSNAKEIIEKAMNVEYNHEIACEINITPEADTAIYVSLSKAFKNIATAMNETIYSAFYLSDGGYGTDFVTGIKPTITQTGDYIKNDPACQFLNKARWKTGKGRVTDIKLTRAGESVSCPVTLTSIQMAGGDANNPNSVSVAMSFIGKPEVVETDEGTSTESGSGTETTTDQTDPADEPVAEEETGEQTEQETT